MKEQGRLGRIRRVSGCTVAAAAVLLAIPAAAAARPGDSIRPRSLHLALSTTATRGYAVNVETVGHHRVVLTVQKSGQFASYTVRGRVNRRRIEADFGRFGRVSLRFHGKPQRFATVPSAKSKPQPKRLRCRGRRPEREVGPFRGTIEFAGQEGFTRLALGRVRGEVRRSYRQVCRPPRGRARAAISSSAATNPLGFSLSVLTASSRAGGALTRFSAISLESPLGIHFPGDELFSIVTASLQEQVGRVRVFRSAFQTAPPKAVRVSRRGIRPATAHVALGSPFDGSARFKGPSGKSSSSWTGSLSVRLLGSGTLPLAGPHFRATLCRASAFNPRNPCFRRAEASAARATAPTPSL